MIPSMKNTFGLVLVGCLAVLLASVLGTNEAVVSVFWNPWRIDLSLNLVLLLLALLGGVGYVLVRGVTGLVGLPARAQEWRARVRERAAQQQLRDAIGFLFAGRYSRAQKSALRAADVASATSAFQGASEFKALALLLAAMCMHRLQDRGGRDRQLLTVQSLLGSASGTSPLQEGASLLAAEWAIDDRDAPLALDRLARLPGGVARRTHALRLRLQAARLAPEPHEALRTARLLAKHQGFSKAAAEGLLRSLAIDVLTGARDREQLERAWLQLDPADRRDPLVCARAASLAVTFGALENARLWLRPHWDDLARLAAHERQAVLSAFVQASGQLPADWLPSLETALHNLPMDPWVLYAAGVAMAERALWGRAARLLGDVADMSAAPKDLRMGAWLRLAAIAEQEGDDTRAADCYRRAGLVMRDGL